MEVNYHRVKGADIPSREDREKERILNSVPPVDRNAKLTHVDEWVAQPCSPKDPAAYAKFFFLINRLHAWMQGAFRPWIEPHELYCDFAGRTWRVTGASRMGDIWLAIDLTRQDGYDIRRYVDECTNWRSAP
jgi:hypothetical protein